MEQRFNPLGVRGRDCPRCYRGDQLVLVRCLPQIFECADGCGARFRFEPGDADHGDTLVRLPAEPVSRLTHAELARVRGGA